MLDNGRFTSMEGTCIPVVTSKDQLVTAYRHLARCSFSWRLYQNPSLAALLDAVLYA